MPTPTPTGNPERSDVKTHVVSRETTDMWYLRLNRHSWLFCLDQDLFYSHNLKTNPVKPMMSLMWNFPDDVTHIKGVKMFGLFLDFFIFDICV